MSEAGEAARLQWYENTYQQLLTDFTYEQLSTDDKLSFDVFVEQVQQARLLYKYRHQHYIFTQMEGIQVTLPNFLIATHSVDNAAEMEAYIQRIYGISSALEQLLERAQINAKHGTRVPRFTYQEVITQCRNVIDGAPFNENATSSPLWADAKRKLLALQQYALSPQQALALEQQVHEALTTALLPAYQKIIAWLEQDIKNSAEVAQGVSQLEKGNAFYHAMLRIQNTTAMTADEIHQVGLAEIMRIREDMQHIMQQVGFSGSLAEFFHYVKHDSNDRRFFYPDNDSGRQAYLTDSQAFLDRIQDKLPLYFGTLPKASLVVKRVEAFREQPGMAQHYYAGAADGSRPGVYYAHLSDMTAMPKVEMEAIAYHEGNPGHHMQMMIAQERSDVPLFRRHASFNGFSEGWAVYTELLAKDMDAYQDPYSDFGRLVTQMWRAVRLVADTGIHSKGLTEAQAVAFFHEHAPRSKASIEAEVRRYFVWPGQATSYMVGMLKILALREHAKQQWGDQFDISAFHDLVLGGGAIPLNLLERNIEQWITQQHRVSPLAGQ